MDYFDSDDEPSASSDNLTTTESRMRTALGLGSAGSTPHRTGNHPPHTRFVKDGQVPVVKMGARRSPEATESLRQRMAATLDALQAERAERAAVERSLVDAQAAIQQLQTKLAHAELAAAEALASERQARLSAEVKLEQTIAEAARLDDTVRQRVAKTASTVARPKPGRPKKVDAKPASEPVPVKWWLPSYKATKRRS